jgi:hypothetical protein
LARQPTFFFSFYFLIILINFFCFYFNLFLIILCIIFPLTNHSPSLGPVVARQQGVQCGTAAHRTARSAAGTLISASAISPRRQRLLFPAAIAVASTSETSKKRGNNIKKYFFLK